MVSSREKQLRASFELRDVDNSGHISAAQLSAVLTDVGLLGWESRPSTAIRSPAAGSSTSTTAIESIVEVGGCAPSPPAAEPGLEPSPVLRAHLERQEVFSFEDCLRVHNDLQLRRVFRKIDADDSGFITASELRGALQRIDILNSCADALPSSSGGKLDARAVKQLLAATDKDCSGDVDFEEFCAMFGGLRCVSLASVCRAWAQAGQIDVGSDFSPSIVPARTATHKPRPPAPEGHGFCCLGQGQVAESPGAVAGAEGRTVAPTAGDSARAARAQDAVDSIDHGVDDDPHDELDIYNFILAGGLAQTVSRTATAPLDRVRIAQQTTTVLANSTPPSALSVSRDIASKIGYKGFWAGNGAACLRVFPFGAITCVLYGRTQTCLTDHVFGEAFTESAAGETVMHMSAATIAASVAQIATQPLDVLRARLAVVSALASRSPSTNVNTASRPDTPTGSALADRLDQTVKAKSDAHRLVAAARSLVREEGARGLYRGSLSGVAAIAPFVAVQLTSFDLMKDVLLENDEVSIPAPWRGSHEFPNPEERRLSVELRPTPGVFMAMGGLAGALGLAATHPIDTFRRLRQVVGRLDGGRYPSTLEVVKAGGGVGALFRGLPIALARVVPTVGIGLTLRDMMLGRVEMGG